MAFTYDVTTDLGRVRVLANDRTEATAIFSDDEIQVFLGLEGANVRRAAALALETIASDEVLTSKVAEADGVKIDGAAVARALLARAAALRTQATEAEDREDGGAFDIAEMPGNVFSARERIVKEWLRRSGG